MISPLISLLGLLPHSSGSMSDIFLQRASQINVLFLFSDGAATPPPSTNANVNVKGNNSTRLEPRRVRGVSWLMLSDSLSDEKKWLSASIGKYIECRATIETFSSAAECESAAFVFPLGVKFWFHYEGSFIGIDRSNFAVLLGSYNQVLCKRLQTEG